MSSDDWPVEVDPVFGCWLWQGKTDRQDGRPLIWRGARPSAAHRVVYEREVGPIGDGLELDHTCRRPQCVCPAHMAPVSRNENELRKLWRYRARMTRCKAGHDLRVEAALTPEGGRVCRACTRQGQIGEVRYKKGGGGGDAMG